MRPARRQVQALREARKRGMLGPTQNAALQEIERRFMQVVEPAATMASSMIAEPISGFVGMAATPFGSDVATRAINKTQEAMTYQPRTEAGLQGLQSMSNFMAPVGQAFEGASSFLGDAAFDATGSPALGAAAYSIPTLGLEALGLKAARAIPGRQFEISDIKTTGMGRRQAGAVSGPQPKDRFVISSNDAIADGYDIEDSFYAGTYGEPAEKISGLSEISLQGGGDNLFGGIFASADESVAASHGSNMQKFVTKNGVADSDDLIGAEKTSEILEKHWSMDDLTPDEFSELSDTVTSGKSLFDSEIPEARLIEVFGGEDLGAADFRAQGVRGMLAKKLGFDAVEMPDEHGTSYLLVGDGVKRIDESR